MGTNLKNLEQLKHFNYGKEFRRNPKNGRMVIVYTWGYPECGKEFMRTWNLLDHVKMHQGIKPFVCPYCSNTFTQKGNLRKHVYIDINPNLQSRRRYKCKFCKSRFTENYNYKVIVVTLSIRMSLLLAISFKFMNPIINFDLWMKQRYHLHQHYWLSNNF